MLELDAAIVVAEKVAGRNVVRHLGVFSFLHLFTVVAYGRDPKEFDTFYGVYSEASDANPTVVMLG